MSRSVLTANGHLCAGQLTQDVLGLDYYVAKFCDPFDKRCGKRGEARMDPLNAGKDDGRVIIEFRPVYNLFNK